MLNDGRGMRRRSALVVHIQQTTASGLREATDDAAARVHQRLELGAAWQALAADDQEVLALHVWEQLTAREAAQVLGCTRAAYAMRLTRAKRRLAKHLTPNGASAPAVAVIH
ncbi:RNA polymerase sigma factor [Streptomyces peucetius]|uniref:RNA polymerase sigma factor 70 region 4 type 2 domain-containing protein n=1 Tax=Streptomyces peucetius TaxID=1950 RepID=A0ABY6IH27_STRPE|nr:sigma factor-like helix-turn-helix DNA-binding protein [Streptomyces peucetius]UYQ66312.1 hypothetical protein OGH68_35945 [Streptomyces peucetius]